MNAIAVLTLLLFYAFVFSFVLPQGINFIFVTQLKRWLFVPAIILFITWRVFFAPPKTKKNNCADPHKWLQVKDLVLPLLPMTPIAQYILLNLDILTFFDIVAVFFIFFTVSFILIFLVPLALRRFESHKILMIVGLVFSYVLFNMASLASDLSWHCSGDFRIQLVILFIFFSISLFFYSLDEKFFRKAIVFFLIINIFAVFIQPQMIENLIVKRTAASDPPSLYALTKGKTIKRKPDIFLLTYDAYVENETMLQYGIDNSFQENYLTQNGFYIYRGTYSIGFLTQSSMCSVLNVKGGTYAGPSFMKLISLLKPNLAARELVSTSAIAGGGAVQNILRENNYQICGVFGSNYFFREIKSSYDETFPTRLLPAYLLLVRSIFEGEFRFNTEFDKISYRDYLSKKRTLLTSKTNRPIFLYAHSRFPGHSQNSGKPVGNEIELFRKKLTKANDEMKGDVEAIEKNNPEAIIIINGDHGPYLTKNCTATGRHNQYQASEINRLDIQDRYGSFLAIKWPKDAHIDHSKIKILQDIFPSVFTYLYDDPSILDSRIEPVTLRPFFTSGVRVRKGVIEGGRDDGKWLFDSMENKP